jgi:hypothetical protein
MYMTRQYYRNVLWVLCVRKLQLCSVIGPALVAGSILASTPALRAQPQITTEQLAALRQGATQIHGLPFVQSGTRWAWTSGWWTGGQPDDVRLDAPAGVDGRATRGVMDLGTVLSNGDQIYWLRFQPGSQRITKTEQLTKELLTDFQDYVRAHAKPCGRCRQEFLEGR